MLSFKYILIPIGNVIISQFIKVIIYGIKYRKLKIMNFFSGMGGMPSSHATLVASISTLMFLDSGVFSMLFGVTFLFSLIVIYDAMGVRYESGLHAKEINKMANTSLTENLGHRPIEVIVGVILGVVLTLIFNKIK